jgi:hypothetical protein
MYVNLISTHWFSWRRVSQFIDSVDIESDSVLSKLTGQRPVNWVTMEWSKFEMSQRIWKQIRNQPKALLVGLCRMSKCKKKEYKISWKCTFQGIAGSKRTANLKCEIVATTKLSRLYNLREWTLYTVALRKKNVTEPLFWQLLEAWKISFRENISFSKSGNTAGFQDISTRVLGRYYYWRFFKILRNIVELHSCI